MPTPRRAVWQEAASAFAAGGLLASVFLWHHGRRDRIAGTLLRQRFDVTLIEFSASAFGGGVGIGLGFSVKGRAHLVEAIAVEPLLAHALVNSETVGRKLAATDGQMPALMLEHEDMGVKER